jgi:hypothetical protein
VGCLFDEVVHCTIHIFFPSPPLDSLLSKVSSIWPLMLGELALVDLDTLRFFVLRILDPLSLYLFVLDPFSTFSV